MGEAKAVLTTSTSASIDVESRESRLSDRRQSERRGEVAQTAQALAINPGRTANEPGKVSEIAPHESLGYLTPNAFYARWLTERAVSGQSQVSDIS